MTRFANAYCGAPPDPASLLSRWNLDPLLIGGLCLALALYVMASRHAPRGRQLAFLAGWSIASLALVSPLCALSVSLFAARVGQHIILALVAAPLLGFALRNAVSPRPLLAAGLFSIAIWFWHAPAPYVATFESDFVYWAMHLTLFGSAIWFWQACLAAVERRALAAAPGVLLTAVQMSLLGALLTSAPRPLYATHSLTTQEWGLTQIADQQLGGVLMWAPGGLLFLIGALWVVRSILTMPARGSWSVQP